MAQLVIYHYDRVTFRYLGTGYAKPNPEEDGQFLIPAFATTKPVPDVADGQEAEFDVEGDDWKVVDLPPPGETVPVSEMTTEQRVQWLQRGVQARLDAQARLLGYDSIFTAVTYADEPAVPKFQAEGEALRAWRSLVWEKCYELLGDYQAAVAAAAGGEQVDAPTLDSVIAELPPFQAPEAQAADAPGSAAPASEVQA